MADHQDLDGAGQVPHHAIDDRLPTDTEKTRLATIAKSAPVSVTGARDDPEEALANLLTALVTWGLISDNTSAS